VPSDLPRVHAGFDCEWPWRRHEQCMAVQYGLYVCHVCDICVQDGHQRSAILLAQGSPDHLASLDCTLSWRLRATSCRRTLAGALIVIVARLNTACRLPLAGSSARVTITPSPWSCDSAARDYTPRIPSSCRAVSTLRTSEKRCTTASYDCAACGLVRYRMRSLTR
jgi:hypothetical protein